MARSSRHRRPESDLDDDRPEETRRPRSRKPSMFFWLASRLAVVFVLLAVLAFFLPTIIGSTGLWKTLVATAAPQLAGKVDASSLSLGWLSPIEIGGLSVRDESTQPLVEVRQIKSRKSLLDLALNPQDLGTFDVTDLQAKIVLRENGSNVEDLLTDLLAKMPKSEKSGPIPAVGLSFSRGSILIDDQVARRQWQIDGLDINLAWTAAAQPKTGKISAAIKPANSAAADAASGQFAADFSWQPGAGKPGAVQPISLGTGQAQVSLNNVPTDIVQGGLRRFAQGLEPSGPLSLQASYSWGDDGQSHRAQLTSLSTPGVRVTAPALLQTDQPLVTIAGATADIELAGGQLAVKSLQFDSNFARLQGSGSARLPAFTAAAPVKPVAFSAAASDVQLSGELDLAELARQLPRTMQLREGTEVTSGNVQFSLAARDQATGPAWEAELRTANLQARSGGRPIRFDQPLHISLLARQSPGGIEIERLTGKASFLALEGSGALAKGSITAQANLDQLVSELKQLIDLGQTRLAGTVDGKLQWSQGEANVWTAQATAVAQGFELAAPGLAPWKEPSLRLTAETQGLLAGNQLARIDRGNVSIEAGGDRCNVELAEVVQSPSLATKWPANFSLRGDLASWAPRLQPVVPLGDLRIAGLIDLAGGGRFSTTSSELSTTKVQVEQLAVLGGGLSIREDLVKIETAGNWNQAEQTLTIPSLTFASSAVAFRADDLRLVLKQKPSLTGLIDLKGNLARLSSWRSGSEGAPGLQFEGALAGHVEMGYRGKVLNGAWNATVENFACLAPPAKTGAATLASASAAAWQPIWEEPAINTAGQMTFDPTSGALTIGQATAAGTVASVTASGAVKKLTTIPEVDVAGEIAYSLEAVTQQIRALAERRAAAAGGPSVLGLETLQLAGKEQRKFTLKGPLFAASGNLTPAASAAPGPGRARPAAASPAPAIAANKGFGISEALVGDASVGWQGVQYVGLVAGPANVRARLAAGNVQIGPLDIPVSEGRLTMAPRLLLNSPSPSVVLDRGPLIQNVRISPEMCSLWLKFVAPMVAEATRAEGAFSLSLQGAAVPLDRPLAADVAGTLAIQSAQIGPGPIAQQFLGVARQLRSILDPSAASAADPNRGWVILPRQDVPFEVRDGVAHHRGLTFTVRDVTITTEGSVGLETQALNLVAQIPIQDSWFKERRLGLLQGKTLRIPIGGTLALPRIDARVLEELGAQLVGSAIQGILDRPGGTLEQAQERGQGLLQRELGRGLDRLFGPRPAQPPPAPPQP